MSAVALRVRHQRYYRTFVPNIKNIQTPAPGYSRGSYIFMFFLAALLAVGGLYVLIFGIPA